MPDRFEHFALAFFLRLEAQRDDGCSRLRSARHVLQRRVRRGALLVQKTRIEVTREVQSHCARKGHPVGRRG
jgi:hypothetical protein